MRWESIGPAGGYIKRFVADDRGRLYAGGDDSSGVWVSDDDGLTWALATPGIPDVCGWNIACAGDRVVIADLYGRNPLLVSDDRGRSWDARGRKQPTMRSRQASCVLVDPDDHDRLVIGTGYDDMRPGDGVWVSDDGGHSWEQTGFPLASVNHLVALDGVVYAGVNTPARGGSAEVPGLYRSEDFGRSWSRVESLPLGAPVTALAGGAGGALYVGTLTEQGSLLRSRDGGASWESLNVLGQVLWNVVELADGTIVTGAFMGGAGVIHSRDGGATWVQAVGIESHSTMGLGHNPATGSVFAGVFANTGSYRSTDGAATFALESTGLDGAFVTNVAAGPEPGHLVATMLGTYNLIEGADVVAAMQTRDAGRTWARLGELPAHGMCAAVDPARPERVLVGTFGKGLFESADGGRTWSNALADHIVTAVAWLPDGAALAASFVGTTATVKRRTEEGHWLDVREPGAAAEIHVRPGLVATVGGDGVCVSRDAGVTWDRVREVAGRTMALDGDRIWVDHGPTRLAASDDLGSTWRDIELPIQPGDNRFLRGILADGDRVLVGVDGAEFHEDGSGDRAGGFLISEDGGATWRREEAGMYTTHVWGLVRDAAGDVYAGTYGGGVFRLHE